MHSWPYEAPTPGRPKCERGKEYHNNCNYDYTGEMFKHFYFNMKQSGITKNNWKPRNLNAKKTLVRFDQREFADESSGLFKFGHLFVPDQCTKSKKCHLLVFFHACQGPNTYETILETGLNLYAETNGVIVLAPISVKCWNTHS